MNKLSVFMIVFNEEKNIKECLERVKWADDIVIVDGGSTDNTVRIAKKYTKRIFFRKFDGYGKMKNFALDKTRNLWTLNLDADEFVTKELAEEIKAVLKNPKFVGYYIPRKSMIGKRWLKYGGQYPSFQLRLFRKDLGRFEDVLIHERVKCNGKVGYLKNDLIHYNFDDWEHVIKKLNFRTSLEAEGMMNKKFVWMYPGSVIKKFFSEYSRLRKEGNNARTSYVLARNAFSEYDLKWLVPIRPILTFLKLYIFLQGFRDGKYGFYWAVTVSYHMFLRNVKFYELRNNLKR